MKPKDILTNSTFCPMPWTGLMYNFDGKVKNCIRSVEELPIGNINNNSIQDIVAGQENVNRQHNIINKTPVSSCQTCYDIERGKQSVDIVSDRIFYIRELKQVPLTTYQSGNFDLKTVDVRWSNLCNFACVYCGPRFSSKWSSELNVNLDTPTDAQVENFKQYIFDHAEKLKHVYLAGGEPLLIKENIPLLNKLYELKPDIELRINTNLGTINNPIYNLIKKFKN